MARSQVQIGTVNRNGQRLLAKTSLRGNDHMQYRWNVECTRPSGDGPPCGHRYAVNGSDFHHRKCPTCQGGVIGLSFVEDANA